MADTPVEGLEAGAARPGAAEAAVPLSADEIAFLTAAADAFIPADALSPSGSQCGVVDFMARELAGAWGAGARLYRQGPVLPGKPEHGYQLALAPRALFRLGIAAADAWARQAHGDTLAGLPEAERIAVLQALESGRAVLDGIDGKVFFEALLTLAMEGFFADPIYGGNRDMAGWRMIGYPGLPALYRDTVASHAGRRLDQAPRSIADHR